MNKILIQNKGLVKFSRLIYNQKIKKGELIWKTFLKKSMTVLLALTFILAISNLNGVNTSFADTDDNTTQTTTEQSNSDDSTTSDDSATDDSTTTE